MKIASAPFLTLLVWSDPVINNRFCRPVRLDVTAGRFDSHPTGLAPAEFAGFPAILDIDRHWAIARGTPGNERCH